MNSSWSKISLGFLFLVATIGTFLRSGHTGDLGLVHDHLVHAHSHVAFQGWIYTLMLLFLTTSFLSKDKIEKGRYPLQFKLTVVMVLGILISFSLQGYALYSIVFSTLFQLLNYWFVYRFLNDTKEPASNTIALKFVKTGLWLGLLSTLFPYVIGVLVAKDMGGGEAYQAMVYSFLHFQYNGWFLFVALGLLYQFFDRNNFEYDPIHAGTFYKIMLAIVVPAVVLSFLGTSFAGFVLPLAYVVSLLNILAIFFFVKSFPLALFKNKLSRTIWLKICMATFLCCFLLKTGLQSLSVLPIFKSHAFENHQIILGYLHLSLIGTLSFLFIGLLVDRKWLNISLISKVGLVLLLSGFVSSETQLMLSGLNVFPGQIALFYESLLMVSGIAFLLFSPVQKAMD